MVVRAVSGSWSSVSGEEDNERVLPLTGGRLRLEPDSTEVLEDGTEVLRRFRPGRVSGSEKKKNIYGAFIASGTNVRVELLSLADGSVHEVSLSAREVQSRVSHYDKAMTGIQRGQFAPAPNERECPRCRHYFICPLAEDS